MEPKPLASLTASLLVRKGQARPALRPGIVLDADDPDYDESVFDGGSSRSIDLPVSRAERVVEWMPRAANALPDPVPAPAAEVVQMPRRGVRERAAAPVKDKISFTLRLDSERHMKVRLLAAQRRTSAQSVIVEALDHYLTGLARDGLGEPFIVKTFQNS